MPIGAGGAGGASASDVRAGGAYVEIYAKDSFSKKLDAVKASAKSQVMGLSKIVGGFALVDVVQAVGAAAIGMSKFNASMEEGTRITARLEAAQDKLREAIFEKTGGKVAMPVDVIPDVSGRVDYLHQKLTQAQKDLAGVGQSADKANAKVAKFGTDYASMLEMFGQTPGGWDIPVPPGLADQLDVGGSRQAALEEAKRQADELNARRGKLTDHVAELQRQIAAQEAAATAAWTKPIREQIDSLNELTATLGMTAVELAIFKAKADAALKGIGENPGLLNQLKQAYSESEFAKRRQDQKDFAKSLENQLGGLTPDQQKLRDLVDEAKQLRDDAPRPILETPAQEAERRKRLERLEKEISTLRGLLAMQGDAEKMKSADDWKKRQSETGGTMGTFGLDARTLGTIGSFRREELSETNQWLREIFGVVSKQVTVEGPVQKGYPQWIQDKMKDFDARQQAKEAFDSLKESHRVLFAGIDSLAGSLDAIRPPAPRDARGGDRSATVRGANPTDAKTQENILQVEREQLSELKQIRSAGGITFR